MSASAIPGATTPRLVDPTLAMRWNDVMMPQTVPNSPMNGVMLAVVARMDIRRSSLETSTVAARSSARSTELRLFKVGRAGAPAGLAAFVAAWRSCVFSSAYPAWKIPTSGLLSNVRQTACTSENFAASPEDVEEPHRVVVGASERPQFLKDDRPRGDGEGGEDGEDDLGDGPGPYYQPYDVISGGIRPTRALHLQRQNQEPERAQIGLRDIGGTSRGSSNRIGTEYHAPEPLSNP